MNLNKITAGYTISVGLLNILLWIFLIISGNIPNLEEEIVSFIFHWISEFSMAGLLVLAGILLKKDYKGAYKVFFFAMGMMLIAILGALIFYIINFDFAFILMAIIISSSGLFLVAKNYEQARDFGVLTLGIIFYSQLNIIGNTLIMDINTFIYTLMAFLPTCALIFVIFLKELKIE